MSVTPTSSGNDFMDQLQGALFSQNNVVSSEGSNIDTAIQGAISGLNAAQQTTDSGLAAGHTADVAAATQQGQNAITAENEARRGMATNTGILANIQSTTNKNIADLDEKYQQAISTGDADTAKQISALQVQALEDKQKNTQQAFTNMLQIASTINQAQQTKDAEDKQNFDEQSSIASIGLQYGIPVTPGMTLGQMVSAAAPKASSEEQAKLGLTLAQTAQAQAEAQKALAGAKAEVTSENAGAFASLIQNLVLQGRTQEASSFLTNIMSQDGNSGYLLVNDEVTKQVAAQFDPNTMGQYLDSQLNAGKDASDLSATITNNPFATGAQKKQALGELVDATNRFSQKQVAQNPNGYTTAFGKQVPKNSLLGQLFQ